MTPSNQHIALLASLGWTSTLVPSNAEMEDARLGRGVYASAAGYPIGGGPLGGMQMTQWCGPDGKLNQPPDLTLDLMASVEATLNTVEASDYYGIHLPKVTGSGFMSMRWQQTERLASASKEQRREAYLRVKGLYV